MLIRYLKKILPNSILIIYQILLLKISRKRDLTRQKKSDDYKRRRIFYGQFLKKGDIYFDIGANYGNRIAPILSLNVGLIVAVEPQEVCCNYLRKTYKGITVLQNGVGEKAELKTFYLSSDSVLSSFSKEFIAKTINTRFIGHTWNNSTIVEIITMDSLIDKYGIPDFVKVDVEGFEREVFNGLSYPLKALSFEYTVPELSSNLKTIIRKLDSIGICVFNYSIGETMEFSLQQWVDSKKFMTIISSEDFISSGFGDIYARFD